MNKLFNYYFDIYKELTVNYTFDDMCPLSQSQMNVFLDELVNETGTGYNNPFKISFNGRYSINEIKNAIYKLFDVYPILKSRIHFKEGSLPKCSFDGEMDIKKGELSDIKTFVRPFELDRNLSRFLIVKDNQTNILCCDFHHLIFDGTSLPILLEKLYSILNNEPVEFVDNGILREISFEETISQDYMENAQKFMDTMLADREECHDLLDSIDSDDEHEHVNIFELDNDFMNSFLKNHRITHNQFFTSVFAYTLSRFTGSPKVLFNLIGNGRGHIDLSQSVGIYAKTLPVLMDCKNQDVASYLKYSSNLIISLMKYDFYPFNILANEYDLNSDITFQYSHDIFYNSMNNDEIGYAVDELEHDVNGDFSFFIFNVDDNSFGIRILFSDKYSKNFAELFSESYCQILHEMLVTGQLSDINYIPDNHIQLLNSYNQTEHDLKYDCVMDAFNTQLIENPDNVLTLSEDANYTYSQIAHIVNGLNSLLKQHEVVSNDIVTVFVDRNHWILITALSCLSQGITYVPIDENHPDKRIEFMIRQSESKAIIVTDTFQKRVEKINDESKLNLNIINVSSLLDEVKTSNHVDYVDSGVNDVACILYTSGTTGNPKAVQMTTLGILNLIEYYVESTGFKSDDVLGIFASVGFAVSLEQFASVFTGGSLTYVPNDIRLNISKLNDYFINYGVTHTLITTQIAKLFVDAVSETSLKYLQTAGEKLGRITPPKNYTFNNVYGLTEANYITSIDVDKKLDDSSVGMLNWNTKVYILDNELRRVPLGAVGEIYLSGYQTTKGYFKNPDENEKALFQNPFDGKINGYNRMYKTGDLGRYLPDGSIAIIGRVDSQVKIRGNRVELSEIEQTIRCIEYIDDVTVQTIKNGSNNELVAYVVIPDFEGDIIEYVKDYMKQNKPDYMVPSFVVSIDKIPVNINGKVDKRALPKIDVSALRSEYVAPRNKLEKDIVHAFEDVFNQEKISIYDNFSRLGGDSLIAIKIISHLNDYNITAADILSLGSPKVIAENINDAPIDLDLYSIDGGCPLNEPQLNVYLDIIANAKKDSYLIPLKMNISKKYSIDTICDGLNEILNVHPILKMHINDNHGVPYLVKGNNPEIIVKNDADETFIHKFLNKGFNLEKSLCKFLINEKTDEYELFCVFHHLIFDGLSETVFKNDLLNILDGDSIDVEDSFLKISAFNQQIQKTEEYGEAKDYYDLMLAESDEIGTLLNDITSDGPGMCEHELDIDLKQFNEFISKNYINENVLFTSVFAYTLSRFTGNDKVLFNIVENGRDRFNNFDSIGMFVNTLPILADCKNQSVSTFISTMSDLIYSVMRYNYYPFRLLANEHNINANIIFQYLPDWFNENNPDDLDNADLIKDSQDMISDLSVIVDRKDDNYTLNIIYSNKYSEKTIKRITDAYNLILSQIINANNLSDINYITKEDLELLDNYNKTEHDLLYDDILDAFNDNLSDYPDNNLVSYNDSVFTYTEGAFIANKIAKSLKNIGVGVDDNVAFLVERSELYMFSVLGILSTGATYVPLDDTHPNNHIQFILEDTQSKAVIVSDDTYEHAKSLVKDVILLNISDILKEDIRTLDKLPVVNGNIACILYTSGTTGIPKGVKITRKSILNLCESYCNSYNFNGNDIYGLYSTIGFDMSNFVINVVAYAGACLSVVPEEIRLDMYKLNNYFIAQNVTHAFITTQVSKLFMESVDETSLDVLLVAGEKLGDFDSPDAYRLIDAYGPTESFGFVSSIDNAEKLDYSSVGFVNSNVKAYVLDDELRRVPIGAVGELYLSGNQIADGYLNRPEKTQHSFVDNPYDENTMYRTGDMVRILPDGTIGFVSRHDSQVKIRGNRLELSEVEAVIREIDYVNDVTVQTIKNKNNNELVAYVVVNNDLDDSWLRDNIQDYIGKLKPEYMIPSYVISLDSIPLNINGKVNWHALPEVHTDELRTQYDAPTTKTEKIIVEAYETVFNQEGISLYDDFVRLGGDSIKAILVISLLQKEGISCNAKDILTYKTPHLIAQNVKEKVEASYDAVVGPVDLLPIQNYFFDEINRNNYTQEFILESSNKLDFKILQEAWNKISNVHDMLRATYKIENSKVVQEIHPLNSKITKLNEYNIYNNLDKNISSIITNSKNTIDISNKLMDISLVHYDRKSYLILVIHHLIIDGVSWSIILDDLTNIYTQMVAGNDINITRPYPYKLWVNNVKELVKNISDEEKQHWIKINSLLDDSDIKGKAKSFNFKLKNITYDADNLLNLSEEEYFALCIARAYKKTYGKEIIFNRETYGRDESLADVNRTVGWFTTQYPISVDIGNDYNSISLTLDALKLKKAFKEIKNLGLNYSSLIYNTYELEFKHCPVTFNFLSTEFTYKNKLFKTFNIKSDTDGLELNDVNHYGIDLNILRLNDDYIITGHYAEGTYLSDKFNSFVDNIKYELEFIGNYEFENIVCLLTESQIGMYLEENIQEKGTAYSISFTIECDDGLSIDDIKSAIHSLIKKHPILKARVLENDDLPLLICDSYPEIEVVESNDYSQLIQPFDLNKSLVRFFISADSKLVGYDMHHIISDANSKIILNRDLTLALNGQLDEDDVDFGFVYASRDSFESKFKDDYKKAYEFFKKHLKGINEIPIMVGDIEGSKGSVSLPIHNIKENVENLIYELGITINTFLNAIFAYSYSRFTGGNKVFYNFTEHGRHEEYAQDAVGMFFNVIPVVIDCKNISVRDYLISVSELLLESMENSVYPYYLLANEFNFSNDVVFEYNYSLNDVSNVGDEIIFHSSDFNPVSDLFCFVNDLDDGFVINIQYSDKYSKDTIIRFLNVFEKILIQMLEKVCLSEIDYVDNQDLILLDSYNQTEHPLRYPDILDAFNANLNGCSENRLVSYGEVSYTYGEGTFIANKIAEKLTALGVKPQDRISFLVERSELYMFAVLGILSMGGVYVPLDDKYPDERIQFILDDSESKTVIVSDETYKRVKNSINIDVNILNISDIMNDDLGTLSHLPIVYGDLACILYTSGTTGIPKGVKITRKSVLNLSEFYIRKYYLSEDDVYALFASIGFDVAMKAIFPTICAGACLSVIPDDIKLDINAMNKYFIEQGITHTEISTQVAKLFINQVDETSLKVLTTGGEKLGESEIDVDYRFVDSYGPTEACVDVTSIDSDERIDPSSIGFLLDNIKAYVLDNEFRRVPIGAVGELYLAGNQISDGYLNRDEETMKFFLENPFDEGKDYSVMYRTGDIVRVLTDGSLGIIGRRDSQVKIRGNRVELSEVEDVIRNIDYLDDVTVQTLTHDGNNELVAYVVVNNDLDVDELTEAVRSFVGNHKPEYMIPSFVVCLDKIPLTVNGKVNKDLLPDVDLNSLQAEYVAPTTLTEKKIVTAFEKVFHKRIGINDDFIHHGGDSLKAIKLLSFIEDYNITAADVLSLRTPYKIAKNIKDILNFDLDIYSIESGCPLNEPQLNVYLDIIANEKFDKYQIYHIMEISKRYDIDEIKNALDSILEVHPILGMCISDEFDVPYLIKGLKPSVTVMSDIDDKHIKNYLTESFDLHDSLCRFIIVDDDNNNYLLACFHHIIYDDLSFNVFERDLYALLDGETCNVDDAFLMASAFSEQIQSTEEFDEAKDFYESLLAGSDESGTLLESISSDGPGVYEIDIELEFNSYKKFLDKFGISKNVLFIGTFAYTLSRFTGSENIIFNILENGRDRFANYDSIGMYVNTLPLHVNCENQDISSFMDYVSNLVYGAMKYNYYPFRLLANKYNVNSNIIFQYVPKWIGNRETYDNEDNDFINNTIVSDLIVEILQKGKSYLLRIKYCDKYSRELIKRFAETYKIILYDMLDANRLDEIDYIDASDVEIFDRINNTEHHLLYEDILDAFNDNLSKYPNNKLVSYNDISYSYSESAFISDKIAKSLLDLGISSQDCVGFLVERSELYPLIIIGIMSIGAVYLPLDENLPDERIRFMLKDSGCSAIIGSDKTFKHIKDLSDDCDILNVSEIVKEDVGRLYELSVAYGDLACILYTSGTTGNPKGVKITRKSILNASTFYADEYGLTSSDVYGLFSTIGFDVSNFIIGTILYAGSCLSVIPHDIRLNMVEMNRYFIKHNVTHAFLTTQVAKLFIEIIEDTSLDVLFVAGEKLGKVESPKDYILVDGFGPTESFAFISSIRNSDKMHESSVGTLNYNTKAYVLDDELRRVPVGAVGELYLAGHQIADGYLNLKDETKNAFVENPFDEGIMYRTGDMVRILPDSTLGFIGRRDGQVKIRGNRVELSEIEAAIRQIEEISDVTVQTINNELTAYVVTDCEIDDLKNHICNILSMTKPDYMIPSHVIKLDSIPLNVNGKVDKHALPQIDLESPHADYVMPAIETERKIVDAFECAFNQKGIGLNDDFMKLGGDSIKAIRVISFLEKNNIHCSARDILNYKTPYIIAQNIDRIVKKSYDAIAGEVDLLPIQSYFFDQINENDFSQRFILKSSRKLDVEILQTAFDELTNIHDMLRARYRIEKNNVIQEIRPLDTKVCEINEFNLTENLKENIEKIMSKSIRSLTLDNLIDISLINYGDESFVLLVIHHLIIDGVSWSILLDDLTYIITQLESGNDIDLKRPYPYKKWVENVRNLVDTISKDEKQHWIEINNLLDDSTIEGKPNPFSFSIDAYYDRDNTLMLSEEEYFALAISRAYKKTYDKDIIFNRESYGRDESLADVSRTVGWFTSQYPIHINVKAKNDKISLAQDAYNLKSVFQGSNNLGLNYGSLIYSMHEMEFKHCPVTFNFLSTEFSYRNVFFESVNHEFIESNDVTDTDSLSYGVTVNIFREGNSYAIAGTYATDNYISAKFEEFAGNIKSELDFIGNWKYDTIVCPLSEVQMGVYLDEMIHHKGIAYSVPRMIECGLDKSVDEVIDIINSLIDRHPVLKGRIIDTEDMPILVCDSHPPIEVVSEEYANLIRPFDLNEYLARFFVIENSEGIKILYDIHHIINDATSCKLIERKFHDAFNGMYDDNLDLGFLKESNESFNLKFTDIYKEAHEFFKNNLSDINEVEVLLGDSGTANNYIQMPIHGIRDETEELCREYGITSGSLFNAVFAYAYSYFSKNDKVYFNYYEHGRHGRYSQDALGMFVRTVPLIVDCRDASIKEYLVNVSDLTLDSMKYSIYPYRLLAKEFNLNNRISFEYNYDLNDVSDIGNQLKITNMEYGLFSDFLCVVNDLDDGYLISVGSCDEYSDEYVIRFLTVFKEVLEGILNKNYLSEIDCSNVSDLELKTVTISKTNNADKRPLIIKARTDIEKEVVGAFEKVFNQEIGIYDDFIQLGGDSLDAFKIKSLLSGEIDASIILKEKTPHNIAQSIIDAKKKS
ncbi:MAG: amino acid adenylation domain-containing protein [Methanobrevibacter sp.]|nr:amino acid adenylation domain-containing protein [Methanobrevibacter sp.]